VVWLTLHTSLGKEEGGGKLIEKNPKEDCSTFASCCTCSWPRWSHKKGGRAAECEKLEEIHKTRWGGECCDKWTFVVPHNILYWPAGQTNDRYSVTECAVVEATETLFSWKVWSSAWSDLTTPAEETFYLLLSGMDQFDEKQQLNLFLNILNTCNGPQKLMMLLRRGQFNFLFGFKFRPVWAQISFCKIIKTTN